MRKADCERMLDLLARSKAIWMDRTLLNLTESAKSPNQASKIVLEATGKRGKAKAANLYAIAMRDYGWDLVGACCRVLRQKGKGPGLETLYGIISITFDKIEEMEG